MINIGGYILYQFVYVFVLYICVIPVYYINWLTFIHIYHLIYAYTCNICIFIYMFVYIHTYAYKYVYLYVYIKIPRMVYPEIFTVIKSCMGLQAIHFLLSRS